MRLTSCFCLCFPLLVPPVTGDRTESVAEKMLTNWFTFLLYKFLKVRLAVGVSLALPQFLRQPGRQPASLPSPQLVAFPSMAPKSTLPRARLLEPYQETQLPLVTEGTGS